MPRSTKTTGTPRSHTAAEKREIREGLQRRLAELEVEVADSGAVAEELRREELTGDEADVAAAVVGHEHESALAEGLQREIVQVEHALLRLSHGDYGRCEQCGRAIPAGRLLAFPAATQCVQCKQDEERH